MTTTTAPTPTPTRNHCRRRPAAPDRRRCWPCLDRAAANARARYARLAATGACTHCGRRPSMPGESRCSTCAHVPAKSRLSPTTPQLGNKFFFSKKRKARTTKRGHFCFGEKGTFPLCVDRLTILLSVPD